MNVVAEKINQELKQHQINAEDWDYKEDIEKFHLWTKILIFEFKLESFLPVIRIAKFKRGTSGCFRAGRNGFGLLNEIGLNQEIINKCDYWEVLGVLLHELLNSEH